METFEEILGFELYEAGVYEVASIMRPVSSGVSSRSMFALFTCLMLA